MAASYPTSVKSFATRTDGQTIAISHVNDLQDEVAALEGGALNGFAHTVKPSAAGGQDLGSTTVPWANGYFTGLPMDIGLCEGRLTLTSGTPVTTTDVTAATSIYFTPYNGNRVALYDGTNWALYTFTELTLALGTITSALMYDVFLYNNSGTLTLELLAWTSATVRATALTTQNGILVKSGATTRRYLGSFYTTSTTTTQDSRLKRFLWNYYNQKSREMIASDAGASYAYTTATWRQARAAATNQIEFIVGVAEQPIVIRASHNVANSSVGVGVYTAVGFDSTSSPGNAANYIGVATTATLVANQPLQLYAFWRSVPAVGYHYAALLEYSVATGTSTWGAGANQTIDAEIRA